MTTITVRVGRDDDHPEYMIYVVLERDGCPPTKIIDAAVWLSNKIRLLEAGSSARYSDIILTNEAETRAALPAVVRCWKRHRLGDFCYSETLSFEEA